MSNDEITVTLVSPSMGGQSESIQISATGTTLGDLAEWSRALFGLNEQDNDALSLTKDGRVLLSSSVSNAQAAPTTTTAQQAGIRHGDVIAIVLSSPQQQQQQQASFSPAATSTSTGGGSSSSGGLDFSALLSSSSSTTASASAPLSTTTTTTATTTTSHTPVYYPGMQLEEAMMHNPHPMQFVTLLKQQTSIAKQFHYHHPSLAIKLESCSSLKEASTLWQHELVKGGIQGALKRTQDYHKDIEMRNKLQRDANDTDAKEYFANKNAQAEIERQYFTMMNDYPESMGRVLMLYIHAKVNGHAIEAFCDSGAQTTIMSKRKARECGILHLVDTRFAGVAVGVGTGKIMGRIHLVSLQIGHVHFPCTVTVMDDDGGGLGDKNMDFLLGLDMMKRHLCHIDLEHGCLKFKVGGHGGAGSGKQQQYLEAPFLHEKDLDETKGGTRGFDAERANQELMRRRVEEEANDGDNDDDRMKGHNGDKKDDDDNMEEK